MTKLLEKAIAKVRELPEADQDALAALIFTEAHATPIKLDDKTRAAIREGLEQARRGDFASEEEVAEIWKKHGL